MLAPNDIISVYRVLRPLGVGGMAAVYEVEHMSLGTRYALKVFTLEEGYVSLFRERFLAEGRILARLSHPGLVRVFDLGYDEARGALFFVMDLVTYKDGEPHTFSDIAPGGATEDQIFAWFEELCASLAYVHSNGIVHRDIKLSNLLISRDKHVVLSDFGISKVNDAALQRSVAVSKTNVLPTGQEGALAMGTAGYVAPEVIAGREATRASDVYSLGVVFFRLLTNVWYDPCLAPSADSESSVGINSVTLLSQFRYDWKTVLPAMLSADPARRPVDLASLPALVKRVRETKADGDSRSWLKFSALRPKTLIRAAVAAVALLSLVTVAVVSFSRPPRAVFEEAEFREAFSTPITLTADEKLMLAQRTVFDALHDDWYTGAKRIAIAESAERLSTETASAEERFLYLKGAFACYLKDGRNDRAQAALSALRIAAPELSIEHLCVIVSSALRGVPERQAGVFYDLLDDLKAVIRSRGEIVSLQAALESAPFDSELHQRLAQCYALTGDWDLAENEFEFLGGDVAESIKSRDGSFWWHFADGAEDSLVRCYRRHAAKLYAEKLKEGVLEGEEKATAKRRIAEAAKYCDPAESITTRSHSSAAPDAAGASS